MTSYHNIIILCAVLTVLVLPVPGAADTHGWYTIHCETDGATVYFDGIYKGQISDRQLTVRINPEYTQYRTLRVEKTGYYTSEQDLLPEPEFRETRHLYVTLREKPGRDHSDKTGSLHITSTPRDVSIYLNGIYQGTTPLTVSDLRPGIYTLEGEMPGYETYKKNARVYADERTAISFSLRSSGNLKINSDPENAYVTIDGTLKGKTPLTVTGLESGEHRIVIDLNGYYNWKERITMTEGSSHSISATLKPVDEKRLIRVTSSPAGAEIYLDNIYQGETMDGAAFPIHDVSTGIHTILLTHREYDDYTTEIEVREGSVISVDAELCKNPESPEAGAISVTSSPAGAALFLDHRDMSLKTPATLTDLSPGAHTITLKLAGYGDVSASVTVLRGQTETLNILFTPAGGPAPTESGLPVFITLLAAGLIMLRRR